jgi:hypothetical protein
MCPSSCPSGVTLSGAKAAEMARVAAAFQTAADWRRHNRLRTKSLRPVSSELRLRRAAARPSAWPGLGCQRPNPPVQERPQLTTAPSSLLHSWLPRLPFRSLRVMALFSTCSTREASGRPVNHRLFEDGVANAGVVEVVPVVARPHSESQ